MPVSEKIPPWFSFIDLCDTESWDMEKCIIWYCEEHLDMVWGTWEIKQVLDEASSDMAFADFDNDGELEMLTISPFHGEKISIFKKTDAEKLTFTADLLDSDVGPANVLHYTNKRLYFVWKQRNWWNCIV